MRSEESGGPCIGALWPILLYENTLSKYAFTASRMYGWM